MQSSDIELHVGDTTVRNSTLGKLAVFSYVLGWTIQYYGFQVLEGWNQSAEVNLRSVLCLGTHGILYFFGALSSAASAGLGVVYLLNHAHVWNQIMTSRLSTQRLSTRRPSSSRSQSNDG
jgi:hypothetical protein